MMNDRLKGFYRDKQIIELVENCKCLNTEQIETLVFSNIASSKRKCQYRLKKLTDNGRLKRWRYDLSEPYAYYHSMSKPVEQMEHTILLNWIYIWMRKTLKSYESIFHFEYEPSYFKSVIPDAFAGIKNKFTGVMRFYFIEMERGFNEFNKVGLYISLYKYMNSPSFKSLWWTKLTNRFPVVLIGTSDYKTHNRIQKAITEQNCQNLDIRTMSIPDIRRDLL